MPLYPTWQDVALRLLLTLIAGGVIGLNREVRGHAAGFRTTILVGLAASVAMLQANILLPVAGKTGASFAVMDVMRLPLGILTGVGFIGGGAILRRGDLVTGITTAATLWIVTVIGLCFGGGQLALGTAATALCALTLWILRGVDARIPRDRRAIVVVADDREDAPRANLDALVAPLGYRAHFEKQTKDGDGPARVRFEIRWRQPDLRGPPSDLVDVIERNYSIVRFELTPKS